MPRIRRAIALAASALDGSARQAEVGFVPPCYWLAARLNARSVMLDMGLGFDADFSQAMIARFGLTSIGFDPTHKHYPQLKQMADASAGRFRLVPVAVGATRGEITFHESKTNVSGSLLNGHSNVRHDPVESYPVRVITLADALAEAPAGKADLVKMDIEGAELDVLDAADDATLSACPQWVIEFHHDLIAGGRFADTKARVRRFRNLGFRVYTRDNVNFLFYSPEQISISETAVGDIATPRAGHDDLTFEQLASTYSYDKISDRRRLFVRLLMKEFASREPGIQALDIGCGTGISEEPVINTQYLAALRPHVQELWGIEPDRDVSPVPGMFTHFQHATLEDADLPAESIDVAYSFLVMEHVPDPDRFMRALYRALKPGGTYLFITPNGKHLFTRLAKTLKKLRLDEIALRAVRGKQVEEYHYPVQYRFNTPRVIDAVARRAGFLPPEYAYAEQFGMTSYFRGPLRPLLSFLVLKRRIWHNRRCLLNLFCRITKPS